MDKAKSCKIIPVPQIRNTLFRPLNLMCITAGPYIILNVLPHIIWTYDRHISRCGSRGHYWKLKNIRAHQHDLSPKEKYLFYYIRRENKPSFESATCARQPVHSTARVPLKGPKVTWGRIYWKFQVWYNSYWDRPSVLKQFIEMTGAALLKRLPSTTMRPLGQPSVPIYYGWGGFTAVWYVFMFSQGGKNICGKSFRGCFSFFLRREIFTEQSTENHNGSRASANRCQLSIYEFILFY